MKTTTKNLKNAIKQLSNVKPERYLYETSFIYCELKSEVLSLTRFNMTCNLTVSIQASGEDCNFSIPESAIKFISNIKSPEIEISLNENKANLNGFVFDCSQNANIKTNKTDYIGQINNGLVFNDAVLKSVPYMAGLKDFRENHISMYFNSKDTELNIYATNCNILRKQTMQTHLDNCEFRLPNIGATVLSKLPAENYNVYLGKDSIKFIGDGFIFNSRLNPKYEIDYECVMPTDHTTIVRFDATQLKQNIPQLKATNKIKFEMSISGSIKLNSSDTDCDQQFKTEFNHIKKTGEDLIIGFSPDPMNTVLETDKEIELKLSTPQRACLIQSNNVTRLIMPIILEV